MNTKSIKKFWSEQSLGTKLGCIVSGLLLMAYLYIGVYWVFTGINLIPPKQEDSINTYKSGITYDMIAMCRAYPKALTDCATAGNIRECVDIKLGKSGTALDPSTWCNRDGTYIFKNDAHSQ